MLSRGTSEGAHKWILNFAYHCESFSEKLKHALFEGVFSSSIATRELNDQKSFIACKAIHPLGGEGGYLIRGVTWVCGKSLHTLCTVA